MLSNLGEDVDDDMVAAMIDMGDVGNTGEVNYDDFLSLMTGKALPPKTSAKKEVLDVRDLFRKLDVVSLHTRNPGGCLQILRDDFVERARVVVVVAGRLGVSRQG